MAVLERLGCQTGTDAHVACFRQELLRSLGRELDRVVRLLVASEGGAASVSLGA